MPTFHLPCFSHLFRRLILVGVVILLAWVPVATSGAPSALAAPPLAGGSPLAFEYSGDLGWWIGSGYSADHASARAVAGDFDGDSLDDTAVMYDYGNAVTRWHVWLSTGTTFDYTGSDPGWWSGSQYDANRASGRVVAADFNGDGLDDVAAMYDYGGAVMRWHIWLSNGSAFTYHNDWWVGSQYDANRATGRTVAADFNGDNLDDVAVMYDYGNAVTRWHVWLSNGSAFDYTGSNPGWWSGSQYNASRATGRTVAGDFDGDGLDDVGAMYDYGNAVTRWHIWLSNGSAFDYAGSDPGWWSGSQYDANRATGRTLAGDFNGDGRDEVAAMYDYSNTVTRWHGWLSYGSGFAYEGSSPGWWSSTTYSAPQATGRVVEGDFDGDSISDAAALYDYGENRVRWHVWRSNAPNRLYLPVIVN